MSVTVGDSTEAGTMPPFSIADSGTGPKASKGWLASAWSAMTGTGSDAYDGSAQRTDAIEKWMDGISEADNPYRLQADSSIALKSGFTVWRPRNDQPQGGSKLTATALSANGSAADSAVSIGAQSAPSVASVSSRLTAASSVPSLASNASAASAYTYGTDGSKRPSRRFGWRRRKPEKRLAELNQLYSKYRSICDHNESRLSKLVALSVADASDVSKYQSACTTAFERYAYEVSKTLRSADHAYTKMESDERSSVFNAGFISNAHELFTGLDKIGQGAHRATPTADAVTLEGQDHITLLLRERGARHIRGIHDLKQQVKVQRSIRRKNRMRDK